MPQKSASPATHRLLLIAGLLVMAFNLRPTITSVSPVLGAITEALHFSGVAATLLTMLPMMCLGLAAPLAQYLARRLGIRRALAWVVATLTLALLARAWTGVPGLFAGTFVAGMGMGTIGILLPGIVKQEFPRRVGLMTGLYTAVLSIGAATAAGATEPLRLVLSGSWQGALTFWALPALLATVIWLPQAHAPHPTDLQSRPFARLLRNRLAWQVTGYMGLQSALAYIVFGWLPTILVDRGMSTVAAGLALSISIVMQIASAILAPWLSSRMQDERLTITLLLTCTLTGLAGCLYAPLSSLWYWIVLLGLGQGGTFSMALTLLALRAPDAQSAGQLSAMAQGFGYVIAACGPLLAGLLHDQTGSWQVTGILYGVIGVSALALGLVAGRNRQIPG